MIPDTYTVVMSPQEIKEKYENTTKEKQRMENRFHEHIELYANESEGRRDRK